MKKVFPLPSFERLARKLTALEKRSLVESLENFNQFLISGTLSSGLGYKKIADDKFEFRVDIKLRVLVKVEGDNYYLVLVGNHDDIRRYLKN